MPQSKKVAIIQSCYLPWKGYFDIIAACDEFIFFDDMQFTKRDWRNRNQIKTPDGLIWLTVPVKVKGKFFQSIRETEIDGDAWRSKHWRSICQNYKQTKYYDEITRLLEPFYTTETFTHISDFNRQSTKAICDYLGIKTKLTCSWDYDAKEGKTQRLVDLCVQAGATEYISGPSAKDYIEPEMFDAAKIKLTWFDYSGYPEYPQLWGEFVHTVSIVDMLFNCGDSTKSYMKY